jgi:hypothetical protein
MLTPFSDALPVRSGRAFVRRDLLKRFPQISFARHLLNRHRWRGLSHRAPWLRHLVRLRRGLVRVRSAVGPLRAVGCLAKQFELLCLLAGRGRLPSPLLGSGLDRLSPALRYGATIRLLSSLRHVILSFFTATARVPAGGGREVSPGKNAELRTKPSPLLVTRRTDIGHRREQPAHPRTTALRRFAFARFHTAPTASTRHSLAGSPTTHGPPPPRSRCSSSVPLPSVWGSLRQGPQRTFTSCLAPVPGARDVGSASLDPTYVLRDHGAGGEDVAVLKIKNRWPRKNTKSSEIHPVLYRVLCVLLQLDSLLAGPQSR